MPKRKPKNPFYVLLLVVGTAFALTGCAYAVMTVRMSQAVAPTPGDKFFDAYGLWIMGVQLTLLTLLTFAAIATDDYWTGGADANTEAQSAADDSATTKTDKS